jgi:hypothetical protein
MNHKIVLLDFVKTSKHTQNCYQTKFFESLCSIEMFMFFEKRKKNMKTHYIFMLLEKKERKGKWKEKT